MQHTEESQRHETDVSATFPPNRPEGAPAPEGSAGADRTKVHRILLVDDEQGMRQFCQIVLERGGHQCTQAWDGPSALAAVQQHTFDLVLLDVGLPGMGGPEVLRGLRETVRQGNLKIIMMSGNANPDGLAQLLAVGADDYLLKPLSVVQLQARVQNALRLKEAQDHSDLLHESLERRVRERTAALEELNQSLRTEIAQRRRTEEQLRLAHAETNRLLSAISSILISMDENRRVTRWNQAAEQVFGILAADVLGRLFRDCPIRWRRDEEWERILGCAVADAPVRLNDVWIQSDRGPDRLLYLTVYPIRGEGLPSVGALILGIDGTEKRLLEEELRRSQKLESIGQLAAGIAPEINTPIQYIGDNVSFLRDAFNDLTRALSALLALHTAAGQNAVTAQVLAETERAVAEAEVAYVCAEIPPAIQQTLEGVAHVAKIVRAMKEFSHPGGEEKTLVDINRAIENTITVARNEWKYVADVVTDFEAALPPVLCHPGDLNQVLLNLLVNAAHAIGEQGDVKAGAKGTITVSTRQLREQVEIRVRDTGGGIPAAIRARIFDPFFTTKPVGKGTGQGLTIARNVIVQKHGGLLTFETEVGKGTTFIVLLPTTPAALEGGQP